MKFLNVYCTRRNGEVFISLDKIILIAKGHGEDKSRIDLLGEQTVEVDIPAEELVRKINGEDRTGIGFRTGR